MAATVNLLLLNELPYILKAYSKTYFIVSVGQKYRHDLAVSSCSV